MTFNQRLARLRGESGVASGEGDLAGCVRRRAPLRARGGQPMSDAGLARLLGGEVSAPGVIEIEQTQALGEGIAAADPIRELPEGGGLDAPDWVCLDTETTGLAGGSGTLAFLVGLGRLEAGAIRVRQFLVSRFAGEAAMLERVAAWIGGAGLISYNGRSFDAPLLATRCRLNRRRDLTLGRPHLDLLYAVRRAFASRWPDCRLATVERRLLGVARGDDLPGAEAPAAWLAHLRQGEARRLPQVLAHNRQDLVSLALLLPRLAAVQRDPGAWDADPLGVARAWLRRGEAARAMALLEQGRAALGPAGLHELARLYRRDGRWEAARGVWEGLAAAGDGAALEALAKYHEHVVHDLAGAAACARRLPQGEARERRRRRLQARLGPNLQLPL